MRKISAKKIKDTVSLLFIEANTRLRKDILSALKTALHLEKSPKAKKILQILIKNARIAKKERLAICQDTGIASVYLELGQDVKIMGGSLEGAINEGVRLGYKKGYFRNSVVDPINRKNTGNNSPAVIHIRIVKGDRLAITTVPKGFGCENKNQLKMFKPTADINEIKKFIVDAVKAAGSDACPPYIIGIGIGGTFEKAAEMSKEALLRKLKTTTQKSKLYRLEREVLQEINELNIGPAGVGGRTTALAVNILTYPTHIAGLPVAVSIGCHAMRSAEKRL
ncbi:MAG: fumarate hydratase [Candidatus Omnitrophica bacterium]|nr:fumarate hydratase [Candidatus Omnitrophota bacterium]